jgi:hypothetical protein
VEVILFDDGDIPGASVKLSLKLPITGEPNIDSKTLVVLGSGSVDAICRGAFGAAGDNVLSELGDSEGVAHARIGGEKYARVLGTGGRNAALGRSAGDGRSSFLGHPARDFVGIVIVQAAE